VTGIADFLHIVTGPGVFSLDTIATERANYGLIEENKIKIESFLLIPMR